MLDAVDFGRVFKKATRSRDRFFTVLCRPNTKGVARLGLAISKKHCRKATARNRIKRIVRESFRHHQAELPAIDVIVINQPAATMAENTTINESLIKHWKQCSSAPKHKRNAGKLTDG